MVEIPRERLPGFPVDECYAAFEHVWDYLDGRLPETETSQLLAHLDICAKCRDFGDFQEEYRNAVARLRERTAAPPELRDKIRSALASEGREGW